MKFPNDTEGMIAWPFPWIAYNGLWDDKLLLRIYNEFPGKDEDWRHFDNPREVKLEFSKPGPAAQDYFDILGEPETLDSLSTLTGIPDLSMELIGGGYHLIPPGGRLAVHTDFNRSPDTGLYRRLNCLTYLNKDWQDPGGVLELWDREIDRLCKIAPEWNRTVIFETSDRSWHGHPSPADRWRFSIAAYFYSPEPPPGYTEEHSTVWMEP